MKARLLICALCLTTASRTLAQYSPPFVLLEKLDLASGVSVSISLQSSDLSFSENFPAVVGSKGSVFTLTASDAWGRNPTIVDRKAVNVYSPTATVAIASKDSFSRGDIASLSHVRRTRADQPFTVEMHVGGFVRGATNDMVYTFDRTRFSPLSYAPEPTQPTFVPESQSVDDFDQPPLEEYQSLSLNGEDPRYACGQQTYTLHWIDEIFGSLGGIDLAKVAIEIWPMTKAQFEGLVEGHVYVDRLPTITLGLQHLYPDSKTYLQFFRGQYVASADPAHRTGSTMVPGTERLHGEFYSPGTGDVNVPQNYSVVLDDLSKYIVADGVWTVEVVTETPFERNGLSLFHLTFEVDRIISTRGQLSARE